MNDDLIRQLCALHDQTVLKKQQANNGNPYSNTRINRNLLYSSKQMSSLIEVTDIISMTHISLIRYFYTGYR